MRRKLAVGLVAFSIVAFFVLIATNNSNDNKKPVSNSSTSSNAQETNFTGTLLSLSKAGVARSCIYTTNVGGSETSAKIYTDGKGSLRYSIEDSSSDQTGVNLIIKGAKAYEWFKTDHSFGFIVPADQPSTSSTGNDVALDKVYSLNCLSWTVDSSQLDIPKDVDFSDISSQSNVTVSIATP